MTIGAYTSFTDADQLAIATQLITAIGLSTGPYTLRRRLRKEKVVVDFAGTVLRWSVGVKKPHPRLIAALASAEGWVHTTANLAEKGYTYLAPDRTASESHAFRAANTAIMTMMVRARTISVVRATNALALAFTVRNGFVAAATIRSPWTANDLVVHILPAGAT